MRVKCFRCKMEVDLNTEFRPKTFSCINCLFARQIKEIRNYMYNHEIVEFTIRLEDNRESLPEELEA